MTDAALRGECLCGGVRYALAAPVETITICHCRQCRRAGGGAFQPVLVADAGDVRFEGEPMVAEYQSSPGKHRAFCTGCGAPVYSRRDDRPGVLRLRAGLIADLPAPARLQQQHRADAWPWLGRLAALVARPDDGTEPA